MPKLQAKSGKNKGKSVADFFKRKKSEGWLTT
jgi:hypothetical protein